MRLCAPGLADTPRGHTRSDRHFLQQATPPMLRPPPLFARAKINYWETTSTTSTWYLWNCGAICTLSWGTFTPQIRSKVPCCTLYCMQVCFAYLLTSVFPFFSARPNSEETQIPISKKKFMMYVSSTKMHLGARNAFSFSLASAKISRAIERSTFRSQILSGLGRIHPTSSAQIPPLLVHPFCFPPIVVSLLFPPLPFSQVESKGWLGKALLRTIGKPSDNSGSHSRCREPPSSQSFMCNQDSVDCLPLRAAQPV